jgi:arginine N-succinyltransferase
MAGRPKAFERKIVAEIRGTTDGHGNSPFWDAVGRLFFGVPFPVADALSFREKRVIADLMPDHPLYVDMLPAAARKAIGVEHRDAGGARKMLVAENFAYHGRVDIFDAGPAMECDFEQIRTIRGSHVVEVAAVGRVPDRAVPRLVCNDRLAFRATVGRVVERDGNVLLEERTGELLDVRPGQHVRIA